MAGAKTLPGVALSGAASIGKGAVNGVKNIVNTGRSMSAKHKQLKSYDEQTDRILRGDGETYSIMEIAQQLEDVSKQRTKYIANQSIGTLKSVKNKAAIMFGGVTNMFTPNAELTKTFIPTMFSHSDTEGYISDDHTELDYDDVTKNLVNETTKDTIMKSSREINPGELLNNAISNMDKTNEPSAFRKSLEQATAELGDMIKKNGEKDIDFFDKDQTYGYI